MVGGKLEACAELCFGLGKTEWGGVHLLIPNLLIPSLPLALRVQRVPRIEIVQQRPGLVPEQFGFLGCACPAFLQVQLWYLLINSLQILGTATAVLPFSLGAPTSFCLTSSCNYCPTGHPGLQQCVHLPCLLCT